MFVFHLIIMRLYEVKYIKFCIKLKFKKKEKESYTLCLLLGMYKINKRLHTTKQRKTINPLKAIFYCTSTVPRLILIIMEIIKVMFSVDLEYYLYEFFICF